MKTPLLRFLSLLLVSLFLHSTKATAQVMPFGFFNAGSSNVKDNSTLVEEVTTATGRIWMDRNLGATQVATDKSDNNSFGDLYQWGRAADGHQRRISNSTSTNATTAVPNNGNLWDDLFITESNKPRDWLTNQENSLWQGISGTNNPCPSGYRLPTDKEWDDERRSWASSDADGAFASLLKLPTPGYRLSGGNIGDFLVGKYWSSTVFSTNSKNLRFTPTQANTEDTERVYGLSIRCIKD